MSRRPIKPAIEQHQQHPQHAQHPHQQQHQQHQQHQQPLVTAPQVTDPNIVDKKGGDLTGLELGGVEGDDQVLNTAPPTTKKRKNQAASGGGASTTAAGGAGGGTAPAKRPRTNTPWTAAEELRLKNMRDAGNSWSEIAKTFPSRTEGSVKKHWYKDMHYAEFGEDESAALLAAIREYDANKWKVIGQKVGKPAKACEQYAKEHFSGK